MDGWLSGVIYLKVVPALGENEGAIEFSLKRKILSKIVLKAMVGGALASWLTATIAGILMSMVAEPSLTSPGGGGFLLAYPKSRKPKLFDFFVNMPNKKIQDPDFFQIEVDFGDSQQQFHVGKG